MDDRRRDQQRQRSAPRLVSELRHDRGSADRDGELRRVLRPWDGPRHLDDDPERHQRDARDAELPVLEQPVECAAVFRETELLRQHRAGARARRQRARRFARVAEDQLDRKVEQYRHDARRPDCPQQALRVRELFVQQGRPAGEPDAAHDSDRRASARRFLGPARDRSGALSDLRSADRQARPRASRVLHPRSVSRQHHSAEPDHQPDVPALRQVSAEAEQQPDRSPAGADEQLSRAHLHRSDPEPDLRRALRLQPLELAPVLRPVERQPLHRRARRLDVSERRHPFRRHEADDECGDRQLDVGEELDDRRRCAVERERVPRGRRSEDAGHDAIGRRRASGYLDEKCAASDEARTGSTRGSSCALPRVEICRLPDSSETTRQRGTTRRICSSPRT